MITSFDRGGDLGGSIRVAWRSGRQKLRILYAVDRWPRAALRGSCSNPHWQMLGALEAADGMLLFGISTAFIFTVMQYNFRDLKLIG